MLALGNCIFSAKSPTGRPTPAKALLLPGNDPKSFCKFFPKLLRSRLCGLLRKNSNILESIKEFLKKQASKLLSCRGGLGEAPYNTPRHLFQRCRSKALWNVGIHKITLFEISYLKALQISFEPVREPRPLPQSGLFKPG